MECLLGASIPDPGELYSWLVVLVLGFLLVVVGGVISIMLGLRKLSEGVKRSVTIEDEVATKKELLAVEGKAATRADLARVEGKVDRVERDMRLGDEKILAAIKELDGKLCAKVDEFGKAAHAGREKLWHQVNEDRERIAAVEAAAAEAKRKIEQ